MKDESFWVSVVRTMPPTAASMTFAAWMGHEMGMAAVVTTAGMTVAAFLLVLGIGIGRAS